MFIPRYWSEAAHTERYPDRRQITVRRFGWSASSQDDADVHARQRVEEALAVLRAAGPDALRHFTRRERTVAYAGSDGLPIREEIVREWEAEEVVATRNSYGALCLNTTRAMFVDVDRPEPGGGTSGCVGVAAGALIGGLVGSLVLGWPWFYATVLGGILGHLAATAVARLRHRANARARDPVAWAIARTRQWCERRPDWRVVVYETPAGARLLPVHARFDAADEDTFEFMAHVGADKLYERMCRLQKCFRARVSPKPWRAGIPDHFRAGGTWPVRDPGKLAVRAKWVARYEKQAREFASCRFVETVGQGRPDADIEAVRRIHDELCRAKSQLPLA